MGNRIVKYAVVLILAAAAALSVYQGVGNALKFSQDFQWDAAKALSQRIDPYELSLDPQKAADYPSLEEFYRMFTDNGLKQKMEANQFPSLLMLLFPMTLFGPQTAKTVWCVLNLLFTAGIIVLLRKTFFKTADLFGYTVITLLMLAGTPYRNQLGVGQHTLFAFFFFMLAVYLDRKPIAKGAMMNSIAMTAALCVSYFKYTLTAPLALYFLYRRRYKEFVASIVIHIAMTDWCAAWLGKSFVYMLTAPLKVASALVSEGGIDLGVIFGGPAGYGIAFAVAAVLTFMTFRFPEGYDNVLLAILIMWSLVLTYHRTYDFFVLSAVYMLFLKEKEDAGDTMSRKDIKIWYFILLVMVYFMLRVFDENALSKIVTGIVYYAFTLFITYGGIKLIRMEDHEQ